MLLPLSLLALEGSPTPAPAAIEPTGIESWIDALPSTQQQLPGPYTSAHPSRLGVGLYYSNLELDEITTDIVVAGIGQVGRAHVSDVDRERIGMQFDFGDGYGRFFFEDFDHTYDLFGAGFGLRSQVPISRIGSDSTILFDLAIGGDFSFGEGDLDVFDSMGNFVARTQQDLWYGDIEGKVGFGVGLDRFVLSAGFAYSFLFGGFDDDLTHESGDFDASNVGGYAGAGLQSANDMPWKARFDFYAGEISGIELSISCAF